MTQKNPDGSVAAQAVLVTTDFTSGGLSTVNLATRAADKNLDTVDAQPVVRVYGGKVYVLDQTHGTVRVYDPATHYKSPTDFPVSSAQVPAAQANPHDIYIDATAGRAYLTLYGSTSATTVDGGHALAYIDLTAPQSGIAGFIPLTVAAGDTDNNPDADRLIECGGTLYISLQNLDRNNDYKPAGPGRLAALTLSQAPPQTVRYIQLVGQNPVAETVSADCTTAFVGNGDYQFAAQPAGKGGIEQVDLTTQKSLGLLIPDTTLGGHVSALDASDAAHVFVDVQTEVGTAYANSVYLADLTTQTQGALLLGPMSYVPAVRVYQDQLLVLSGGTPGTGQLPAGLYLGSANGQPLPAGPIDVGLPPIGVDILP